MTKSTRNNFSTSGSNILSFPRGLQGKHSVETRLVPISKVPREKWKGRLPPGLKPHKKEYNEKVNQGIDYYDVSNLPIGKILAITIKIAKTGKILSGWLATQIFIVEEKNGCKQCRTVGDSQMERLFNKQIRNLL